MIFDRSAVNRVLSSQFLIVFTIEILILHLVKELAYKHKSKHHVTALYVLVMMQAAGTIARSSCSYFRHHAMIGVSRQISLEDAVQGFHLKTKALQLHR